MGLVLLLITAAQGAAQPPPPSPNEANLLDCIEWMQSLDIIANQPKPKFVRTQVQHRVRIDKLRDLISLELSRDETSVRCLTLGLQQSTVQIKQDQNVLGPQPASRSLDYRHAFLLFRRELTSRLRDYPKAPLDEMELSELVTFLVISRNAGETDSYNELVAKVRSDDAAFAKLDKKRLEASLASNMLHVLNASLGGWESFGQPLLPREQLLSQVRVFLKRFPNSKEATRAKQMVPLLQKSIADQKRHPRKSPVEIQAMAERKDVAGLIGQLQYVSGGPMTDFQMFGSPFGMQAFVRFENQEGPANELAKLGDVAVPKLIEALGDTRLTHLSTAPMDDGHFRVLSCGECVAQILDEIMAGEAFASEFERTGLFEPKPCLKKIERRARDWWEEYQQADRAEFWVRKLDQASGTHFNKIAERLLQADPKRAAAELIPRMDKQSGYSGQFLIESIAKNKPAGYRDLLRTLAKSDSPSLRLAAITESWKLDKQTSLDALWQDWQQVVSGTLPGDGGDKDPNFVGNLSMFLLQTGPDSIDRIRGDLSKVNGYTVKLVMWRLPVIWNDWGQEPEKRKEIAEWRGTAEGKAVTRLLIAASEDQRRQQHSATFPDYRVCDQAAKELRKLLTDPPEAPAPPRRTPEDPADRQAAQDDLDQQFDEFIPVIRNRARELLK